MKLHIFKLFIEKSKTSERYVGQLFFNIIAFGLNSSLNTAFGPGAGSQNHVFVQGCEHLSDGGH